MTQTLCVNANFVLAMNVYFEDRQRNYDGIQQIANIQQRTNTNV